MDTNTLFSHLTQITTDTLDDHISDLYILQTNSSHHDDTSPSGTKLGMYSGKSSHVKLTNIVNDKDQSVTEEYTFEQSISNLNNTASSTGFVLWKISVPFLNWLLVCPYYRDLIHPSNPNDRKFILELGSGVSGLFSCFVGRVSGNRYVATDQYHLMKLLKKNIGSGLDSLGVSPFHTSTIGGGEEEEEHGHVSKKMKSKSNNNKKKSHHAKHQVPTIDAICYDWENIEQGQYELSQILSEHNEPAHNSKPDLILGCDIVYNDYLVPHLVNALDSLSGEHTVCLIGLQLRLLENIELFVAELLDRGFEVYQHMETVLSDEINNSGPFVIYYIRRRNEK
ncbi:hypothetical protein WICPIJ_009187 [Wickerhamomyces pijperi]|uniref:Ribosomal lysine N-methyltransferase 5 n=1 Tax=Wickerhamomyces pijperi TaxID=599730 RepID=A0A9P8PRF1_WICPI|nr:hypothetical protein WICPIJ_009187 [Wickerhamomyces pijperi]